LNSAGTNPTILGDAGSFLVQTYALKSGTYYPVDQRTFLGVFATKPLALDASLFSISSYQASAQNVFYTFKITPAISIG